MGPMLTTSSGTVKPTARRRSPSRLASSPAGTVSRFPGRRLRHLVSGIADGLLQTRSTHRGRQVAHARLLRRQIHVGLDYAGQLAQGALHAGAAIGAGHAPDGDDGGFFHGLVARILHHRQQGRYVHGVELHRRHLGGEIDVGLGDPIHAPQCALHTGAAVGAGHSPHAEAHFSHSSFCPATYAHKHSSLPRRHLVYSTGSPSARPSPSSGARGPSAEHFLQEPSEASLNPFPSALSLRMKRPALAFCQAIAKMPWVESAAMDVRVFLGKRISRELSWHPG